MEPSRYVNSKRFFDQKIKVLQFDRINRTFVCPSTGYNDWSELSFDLVPNFNGVVWDFNLSMFAYSDLQLEIRL